MNTTTDELRLTLRDTQWPYEYTDHQRMIVRAVVFDDEGYLYFVRAERDDDFGRETNIETAGGGVEEGEEMHTAIKRELEEELGVYVDVLCRIGVVEDYYNLIHRHNINNYYLCRVTGFCERHLTDDERDVFHLSVLKLTYEDALNEYEKRSATKLGRLLADREIPVLDHAMKLLREYNYI